MSEVRSTKREDIIRAAKQLMQARNASGFSMRTLAEVAGVSIATPYNLFGSKQAIIAAVMDADLDELRQALFAKPKDPIEIFFHLVDVSAEFFEAEPGFYKAGASAIEAETDSALANHFGLPRHALLRSLVSQAVQNGHLAYAINPDSIAVALGQQFFGWIQAWSRDQISLADMVTRTQLRFLADTGRCRER
ncbi:MAG: TetR/AcrR family transcriptional regulator [Gammaproteobacteria bacterium]|nr:TetR/AcrR family transcriptional regulator [Gammaproteobacteria bacterium]